MKMRVITLDPTSWSIKEVITHRTKQPDYRALTLSLSLRSFMVGLRCSPWYVRSYPNTVALHRWPENGPSCYTEEIAKDFNKSPSGWPALAASWQSVFGFLYWGARAAVPGHNRSSSPSTTLANIAECKLPKNGSRANPTIDPRHDSEPIHIML